MVEMLDICLLHPKSRRPRNRSELFAPLFGMIRNRSATIPSGRAERNSENLYLRAAENALIANDCETPAGRLNVRRTCQRSAACVRDHFVRNSENAIQSCATRASTEDPVAGRVWLGLGCAFSEMLLSCQNPLRVDVWGGSGPRRRRRFHGSADETNWLSFRLAVPELCQNPIGLGCRELLFEREQTPQVVEIRHFRMEGMEGLEPGQIFRNQQVAGSTPAGGSIKLARRACRSSSRETLYRIRDRLAGSLFDAGDGQRNTAPQAGFLLERRTLNAHLVHREQPDALANFPSHGVQ